MEALPEWLGNLTSLINLHIWDCKNLMRMQRLTKLETLSISGCPSLAERCAKESGPEWHMISHIPRITVDGVDLPKESESSSDDSTHSKPHQTSTFVGFQKDLTQLEEQVMRKRCKLSAESCVATSWKSLHQQLDMLSVISNLNTCIPTVIT
ncbi:unnamed protein product [Prunus armeniaca]|uniref:Uncharacterized protein n=1 Tax=Prunus armeniaca TaxID=36596 RepID=A0A6J5THC5_PRUAR|nr:unnamed protein product [Prunus armeniaca]